MLFGHIADALRCDALRDELEMRSQFMAFFRSIVSKYFSEIDILNGLKGVSQNEKNSQWLIKILFENVNKDEKIGMGLIEYGSVNERRKSMYEMLTQIVFDFSYRFPWQSEENKSSILGQIIVNPIEIFEKDPKVYSSEASVKVGIGGIVFSALSLSGFAVYGAATIFGVSTLLSRRLLSK